MKTYMLRFMGGTNVTKPGAHSAKYLFVFDVIEIDNGVETVLQKKVPINGSVSEQVINMFQLDPTAIADAALSCVVKALKTERNVQAVVDHEYKLGTNHLLNNQLPTLDNDKEFQIEWDN